MKILIALLLIVSPILAADIGKPPVEIVSIGQTVTLLAGFDKPATNPPDTVYKIQWLRGASAISGATGSEYRFTLKSAADLGEYSFHVTATHPSNPTITPRVTSNKVTLVFEIKPAENVRAEKKAEPATVVP